MAEQSKQATGQVRAILGDIQKATSAAVMATKQAEQAAQGLTALAHRLGAMIASQKT